MDLGRGATELVMYNRILTLNHRILLFVLNYSFGSFMLQRTWFDVMNPVLWYIFISSLTSVAKYPPIKGT